MAVRDLYKWLDMLQTSELHLTRADQMEDRWEGSYSEVNLAQRPSLYGANWPMMAPRPAHVGPHRLDAQINPAHASDSWVPRQLSSSRSVVQPRAARQAACALVT